MGGGRILGRCLIGVCGTILEVDVFKAAASFCLWISSAVGFPPGTGPNTEDGAGVAENNWPLMITITEQNNTIKIIDLCNEYIEIAHPLNNQRKVLTILGSE